MVGCRHVPTRRGPQDQHGTAIITTAALRNAAELVDKPLSSLKVTCIGAGAAATSCMMMWVRLGVKRENITMTDVDGVLYADRGDIDEFRAPFARPKGDGRRTLADAPPWKQEAPGWQKVEP